MRVICLEAVYQLAKRDKRVVFIGSDLGAGVLAKFKEEMPDRFFMEGISEQHVIGMAAGLAMDGFIPYVNTIGTFLTKRSPISNIFLPRKFVTNNPSIYTSKTVRIIPNPGISRLIFFKIGPDISSSLVKRNLITTNVKYKGKRVAKPANNFDLNFCIMRFI